MIVFRLAKSKKQLGKDTYIGTRILASVKGGGPTLDTISADDVLAGQSNRIFHLRAIQFRFSVDGHRNKACDDPRSWGFVGSVLVQTYWTTVVANQVVDHG